MNLMRLLEIKGEKGGSLCCRLQTDSKLCLLDHADAV